MTREQRIVATALAWREAVRVADDALIQLAKDYQYQRIEPDELNRRHRKVTALETDARLARDAFDAAVAS